MSAESRESGRPTAMHDVDAHSREILDLYDLAVLLTYERWTADPTFRNTKLTDFALNATDFQSVHPDIPAWHDPARATHRRGFYFTQLSGAPDSETRDAPETMLPDPPPPGTQYLSARQRETVFYQARAVGSSESSAALVRCLLALFPPDQLLRVRGAAGGAVYARAGDAVGERYALREPGPLVLSIVRPARSDAEVEAPLRAFGESETEQHCVVSLPTRVGPGPSGIAPPVVLDLASLAFGDAGRPFGGKGLFALEPRAEYERRLRTVAREIEDPDLLGTSATGKEEEEALREIARRVRDRYARRHSELWCGHCGAPRPANACAKCLVARFCSREHQIAAWPMHKHQCKRA